MQTSIHSQLDCNLAGGLQAQMCYGAMSHVPGDRKMKSRAVEVRCQGVIKSLLGIGEAGAEQTCTGVCRVFVFVCRQSLSEQANGSSLWQNVVCSQVSVGTEN